MPTDPTPEEKCETCRFWQRADSGDFTLRDEGAFIDCEAEAGPTAIQIGSCRRLPPVISGGATRAYLDSRLRHNETHDPQGWGAREAGTVWPVTWVDQWCGEYQRRPLPLAE